MKWLFAFTFVLMTSGKWPIVLNIPIPLILFVLILLLKYQKKKISILFSLITAVLLAIFVVASHLTLYQNKIRTALSTDNDTLIQVKIINLFTGVSDQKRILAKIVKINDQILMPEQRVRVYLYSHLPHVMKQGQIWEIRARLREPYGRVNEAGFDAERYYLSRHIHAKGSILEAKLINSKISLRQTFFDWFYPQIQSLENSRFLVALSFGERDLLSSKDWTLLKNSGLAHLLAISGLHIGLAYFFGFSLMRVFNGAIFRHYQYLYFPYLCGCFFSFSYAWLAGFSLPTERALLALLIFTLIRVLGFCIGSFSLVGIVLFVVLIFDPFAVFSASFWLSFGAVFILLVFFTFFSDKKDAFSSLKERLLVRAKQLIGVQCIFALGMLPIMAAIFNGMSLSGLFYNLFAVPWVSFLVVPLVLLSLILSPLSLHFLCKLTDLSIAPLIHLMQLSENHWLVLNKLELAWLCLIPIICLLVFFRLWRLPVFFSAWFLLFLFWRVEKEKEDTWQVDILDVGHGLAVLIAKEGKAILYDTGPAWQKSSIAESVIIPVIEKRGVELTDIILSHSDKDHAGGIGWLTTKYPNARLRTVEEKANHLPCIRGQKWQWQGLNFTVLHPKQAASKAKNADSCVIKVANESHSLLLTGDLLSAQETQLVNEKASLSSQVLIVPHHGSKSSSSELFLQAVAPKAAIVSRGRYTPWDLPNKKVVERYQKRGIQWFDTAMQGQIRVLFTNRGWQIKSARFDLYPYWHRRIFGEH